MYDIDTIFTLVKPLVTKLDTLGAYLVVLVAGLALAKKLKGLLKWAWEFFPKWFQDILWYFVRYALLGVLLPWRNPKKILLKWLDRKDIAIFLEMDYQYSEQLVRLYDKFYTNYVVIWDRFKNNAPVYNILCKQMKSKMRETFVKTNIDRNNAHIRLYTPLLEQRKLETIIINDRQEFGGEMKNKMKMSDQNNRCRCVVVPMLTEEVINYVKEECYDVDKVLIFTILEIPSKGQFEEIDGIKKYSGEIVYAPLISQEIIDGII